MFSTRFFSDTRKAALVMATSTSSGFPSLPPQLGAQSNQGLLCPQQREGASSLV